MAIGDVYRVALVGQMHGHLTVNTFHYAETSAVGGLSVAEELIGNAFEVTVSDVIKAVCSNAWRGTTIEVQKIGPLPVRARFDKSITAIGEVDGPAVPDTVALVVRRRGPLAGRANRGRIYIPGVALSNYEEGTGYWDPLAFEDFDNIRSAMTDVLQVVGNSAVWTQCLFNRVTGIATLVTAASWDLVPRSQRRREIGVGV